SICDAIVTPMPGEITFGVNRVTLAGGLAISDAEAAEAIRIAFRYLKCVIEPGGAVALAALLSGKIDIAGKTAVAVASGGNVDADLYARILMNEI
ncbi:MAG: pyridoxal-phosphate dependent enzyme, partial [Alphaproteobacteria bacterium]